MKMAIVGCEASGKTVFMCAMADYYGRDALKNSTRLRLTPENSAANGFERYQFRQMRSLRQWPYATPPERTIELKWSLRKGGESIADIDLLEFGGETFRAAFKEHSNETEKCQQAASVAELMKYLNESDFFVVLVSIKALLTNVDNQTSEGDYDRETESLWVTRGIINFIRKQRPNAGMVIGLTQADRYQEELKTAGGARALLAQYWPTVAAAAENIQVVEVASVSKTDEAGNPADGYDTHGILPVMQAFSQHCFGNANALENGKVQLPSKSGPGKKLKIAVVFAIVISAICAATIHYTSDLYTKYIVPQTQVVTNLQERVVKVKVEVPVTNIVEKIIKLQATNIVKNIIKPTVTNTIEKIVERRITNTVEKVVERQVTNTVEKVVTTMVKVPVNNVVERVIERIVTNVIEKTVPAPVTANPPVVDTPKNTENLMPPGYRNWTDYNGHRVAAKWIGVSPDRNGITLISIGNRQINAVLWKFSPEDQTYIKNELQRHDAKGEILSNGEWVKNPLLKK